MYLHLSSLFFLKVAYGYAFFTVQEYPNLNYCKNILRTYLNDQSSVKVFNFEENESFQNDIIMKALQTVLPAVIFSEINENIVDKHNDMGDELNVPSTSKSYFAMASSMDKIYSKLHLLAQMNINGKWVFLFVKVTTKNAEEFIIATFKNYKMLNVLIFLIDDEQKVSVMSFNPFHLDSSGQRGEVWVDEVKLQNLPRILAKIDGMCEKKVQNLNGYELKVSTFYETSEISKIIDEQIPSLFKKSLNCKYKYFETQGNTYGSRLPNGSFTGEIGLFLDVVLIVNFTQARCVTLKREKLILSSPHDSLCR